MPRSKEITWNGISSDTIPELVIGTINRQLLGSFQGSAVNVPGRPGGWFFSQPRGFRKITAECFVEVDDMADRRDAVTAVADWLDVEEEGRLFISDEPGVFYLAHLTDPGDVTEWRQTGVFELTWQCQPYSFDIISTVETWTSGIDTDHTWNPALKVPTYPVIEIKPTNGTLTGFTLETNGDLLTYVGSLADDATLTINSIGVTVTAGVNTDTELTGAFNPAYLVMSGVSGEFPVLLPGVTNNVHFTKTGGTATAITITVTYRKSYRR